MIFSFIRTFFEKKKKQETNENTKAPVCKQSLDSPDFIDYDGMGNQGRFPRSKR